MQDLSWMDTTYRTGGFRAVAGTRLILAVAKKPQDWDKRRVYDVPAGYRWATTNEVLAEARTCTEHYDNQKSWRGWEWPDHNDWKWKAKQIGYQTEGKRIGYVCADSLQTGKMHYAGNSINCDPMSHDLSYLREGEFAGLICIRI